MSMTTITENPTEERSPKVYLLNSLIAPVDLMLHDTAVVEIRRISLDAFSYFVAIYAEKGTLISAVGHQSTCDLIAQITGVKVPMNRITVKLNQGDKALIIKIDERLPEGAVLDSIQLQRLLNEEKLSFYILKVQEIY